MPCSFGRQLGGARRSVSSSPWLAVHLMLKAAALFFGYSTRVALHTLIHSSGVGQLRGMPCTLRLRVGIELCVCARGTISALSVCIAPHELPLGQGPCSVGEPWREPREFHWPGGPPQVVKYALLVLRGNGMCIENHVLDVGP